MTRNRRGGGNRTRLDSRGDDGRIPTMSEDTGDTPTLDCVICYNEIDVNDRRGYMLAPCDHIFHRRCLEQWMDVKVRQMCDHVQSAMASLYYFLSLPKAQLFMADTSFMMTM